MATETIFSKIIRREISADIVYEDDTVLAFRDINPQAPIHILVIPKEPLVGIQDARAQHEALLGQLLLAAQSIAQDHGIAASGYRLVVNAGPDGGQEIAHLHIHLLGGRPLSWPPG
ncbi:MAG: histidine triad nucleotide-binding protein [Candidatus Latescibacterota bacterium]|jgi:histidine triad (HIT) family protein|tara:strand:+ start:240 stop:587 length:348 start_codon:yes stop_codon:yes gene_type:complete